MPQPSNYSRLRKRPARCTTVVLAEDPNDVDRLNEAELALYRAENADPVDQQAVSEARAARDALVADIPVLRIHLRSCGAQTVEKLQTHWPATDEQQNAHMAELEQLAAAADRLERARPEATILTFDRTKFPPLLLAACCTSIEFSDGTTLTPDSDDLPDPERDGDTPWEQAWLDLWNGTDDEPSTWSDDDLDRLIAEARQLTRRGTSIEGAIERAGKG